MAYGRGVQKKFSFLFLIFLLVFFLGLCYDTNDIYVNFSELLGTAVIGGFKMKEFYNAPVLNLISFVPNEKLATGTFDYDDMEDENWVPAEESTGDLNYDFSE